ncbi:MAG: TonB-dependent receptor [Desulfobacteraceae bacterium]|nr:TonB-dependent receptor [Desulfobacteraceae bacterium]
MAVLLLAIALPSAGFSDEAQEKLPADESGSASRKAPKQEDQAQAVKDHRFDEVVVTATRTEKSLSDVPAAVSVVTREDIANRNVQKIDEAIDLVPGLFDKRSKGLDTTGRVILRGIPEQKRTLVLVDGQPLNNGYTGLVDWNSFNPEDIQRIEVARGPFSSLYGGNAMGGVINIITRMPEKREITLKGGYGSDNYWTSYGSYGDKFDRLSVFMSYGHKESDGYPTDFIVSKLSTGKVGTPVTGAIPTTDTSGSAAYIIGNKGDNHWWTDSGSIKLQYDITPNSKAYFSYRNNQYGYGYDNPESYLLNANGSPVYSGYVTFGGGRIRLTESMFLNGGGSTMENYYNAGYETKLFDSATLKISGGLLDMPSNWYVTPTSGTATRTGGTGKISDTPSQQYYTDVQLSFPVMDRHLITVGTAFRHDEATNQEYNLTSWLNSDARTTLSYMAEGKDNIFSFYSQAEIALLPNVTLYGGFRGDYWETYDGMANQVGSDGYPASYASKSEFSINPKGSVVYKPLESTALRASIGTAFRAPNVYELYRTWVSSGGVTYQGNPNLDPETSVSWDVGVEQKLGSRSVAKLTYFHNTIDNFIYIQSLTSTLNIQTNAGEAETKGVELEVETRPWDWLKLFGSATYTDSVMLNNPANPLTEGKQLTGVPKYMYALGGETTWRDLTLTLTGRYASKQYNNDRNTDVVSGVYGSYDAFFLVDLCARYKVGKWTTLDFGVSNILDEQYYSYYKAPGRKYFGGVTVKF